MEDGGEQPEKEAQRETMNGPVTLAVRGSAPAKLHKSESAARNFKLAATRAITIASTRNTLHYVGRLDFKFFWMYKYSLFLNNVTAVTVFTSVVEPFIRAVIILFIRTV